MSYFRANVDAIGGYVPGEQPQETGWIKLNTNENPYPPSPRVQEAIVAAATGRLNRYPDPLATGFRKAAGEVLGVDPEWILPTNGSDEVLTILTRAFVNPTDTLVYPYPSYILYETLAALQGARCERILLEPDWSWNFERARPTLEAAKLLLVPNPNSPSGTRWDEATLRNCLPPRGILVIDEAYGDFADAPHGHDFLKRHEPRNVIVTRTFSKSYSLAGIRFGFGLAHPDLIAGLRKVKDSYNCDAVSIAAATAAILDQPYMHEQIDRIRRTRARLATALADLGFAVTPSEANFVWCRHRTREQRSLYQALKERKILIRYMVFPGVPWGEQGTLDGLRITVGTDEEIDQLLSVLRELV